MKVHTQTNSPACVIILFIDSTFASFSTTTSIFSSHLLSSRFRRRRHTAEQRRSPPREQRRAAAGVLLPPPHPRNAGGVEIGLVVVVAGFKEVEVVVVLVGEVDMCCVEDQGCLLEGLLVSGTKDMTWRPDLFSDSMAASGIETGTKLYISNLDYGVSNEDIKELFSEVGHLKRFAVHFDGYGRPNGTAEVVFTRRSDAIAALKRYNNVLLDGKAMKIEVIGSDLGLPMTPRINVVGASNGRPTRTVVMTNRYNRGAFQAGRGRGRGRGRAPFQSQFQGRGSVSVRGRGQFQGRGRGRRQAGKTADELDKDLESYHAEAMKTD
uniref:RRM domain-containing protein n=1 Tax=Oryza punctata TaxID=4537 RepID=A0A0E0LUT4_ORYPU